MFKTANDTKLSFINKQGWQHTFVAKMVKKTRNYKGKTRMTTSINSEAFEKKPRKLKNDYKTKQKIISGKTVEVSYWADY